MVTISIQSLLTCHFIEQIILILFNDEIEKKIIVKYEYEKIQKIYFY